MKKIVLILVLLLSTLYAVNDINITNQQVENSQVGLIAYTNKENGATRYLNTNHLGDLGGFLEPILAANTQNITHLIMMFAAFITFIVALLSLLAFFNIKSLEKQINTNKGIIKDLENKLEKSIKQEVKSQIIYSASNVLQKVEDDAYEKIDHAVNHIKGRVKSKLFDYQKFIFKVNQAKKYEYEEVLNDAKISIDNKLQQITIIQGRYNEINNNDIPKLFSDNVKDELIPVAIKLSKERAFHDIIIDHLKRSIKKNGYSYADISRIKEVVKKYYNYDMDEDLM